jgi:hypothetical protein
VLDQGSAEERKVIEVEPVLGSGQCRDEEGDRGGQVNCLSRNLCDKFSSIPFTHGCLMQWHMM